MNLKELIKRNKPVFVIGGITVLLFIVIIISAAGRNKGTTLKEVEMQELIAPHTYVKGPDGAKVTIVEFTDFGCPACKDFHPKAAEVYEKYSRYVRYGLRHFPLPQHKDADKAAVAAQVAGEQGKFWEYADVLFEFQGDFKTDDLVKYADLVGLDLVKFKEDLKNNAFESLVRQDIRFGKQIGVNSTPTFYVNGEKVNMSNEYDLERMVRQALKDAGIDPDYIEKEEQAKEEAIKQEVYDEMHKLIDESSGVLEIEYTEEDGFTPRIAEADAGQLVRWTNKTDHSIYLEQLMMRFDELNEPVEIKAGETFEFRLYIREQGFWTYKERDHEQIAKLNIAGIPGRIKELLP